MIVIRAETAGFCMGVDLALRKLDEEVERGGEPICTLGPIIHNPQVLEEYEGLGVRRVESPDEVPDQGSVVVRAHGIPQAMEKGLRQRGARVVDATCPRVKRAQVLIAREARKGHRLFLFGEEEHPEVKGLRSYAGTDAIIFDSLDALEQAMPAGDDPIFLAAQTTQDRQAFEAVVAFLQKRFGPGFPILDTICDATRVRQEEALAVARRVEAMVVAGGFESGNTRRLAHVVESQNIYCVHVETPEQLPLDQLRRFRTVGLTGGASTPKNIIDAIQAELERL